MYNPDKLEDPIVRQATIEALSLNKKALETADWPLVHKSYTMMWRPFLPEVPENEIGQKDKAAIKDLEQCIKYIQSHDIEAAQMCLYKWDQQMLAKLSNELIPYFDFVHGEIAVIYRPLTLIDGNQIIRLHKDLIRMISRVIKGYEMKEGIEMLKAIARYYKCGWWDIFHEEWISKKPWWKFW